MTYKCWCLQLILLVFSAAPIASNPIISRGKPVRANPDNEGATSLVDGIYGQNGGAASWMPPTLPAWAAIRVGSGFQRLLLSWSSPGNASYTDTQGAPADYSLEVSANSTDGQDGTWTTVATVSSNSVRSRAHSFAFAGQQWVRMTITRAPRGVNLDEIDVHDVTAASSDTWFFLGDSITAISFDRTDGHQPSFAADINGSFPSHFPAMIDGGVYGDLSADGVRRIDSWLAMNPDSLYWAIGYGTNDSGRNVSRDVFKANMQTLISHVTAAGRVPILARIPRPTITGYDSIPDLNQTIDELVSSNGLTPGPDFYAWFANHPDQIGPDGIHPNNAGAVSMNRLWAEAVAALYVAPAPPPPPVPAPPPPTTPPPASPPSADPPDGNGTTGSKRNDRKCGMIGMEGLLFVWVGLRARSLRRCLSASPAE